MKRFLKSLYRIKFNFGKEPEIGRCTGRHVVPLANESLRKKLNKQTSEWNDRIK